MAHRWALDSSREADLTVLSEQRIPIAMVRCRVATAAALVAKELQSASRPRGERAHKGPNDYGDPYPLLRQPESCNDIVADLPNAPRRLGQWCAERTQLELVAEAGRTARAIRQTTLPDPPTPEDIARVGRAALLRLALG